jgi:hypothetical protein
MSIKSLLACVLAAIAAIALVIVFVPATDSSSNYTDAKLVITTGLESSRIVSHLQCSGKSASGDGVYSAAKKAAEGCRAVTKLKAQLQAKPAICPGRSQGGGTSFSVKGEVDGQQVNLQSFQQDCSQSLTQISNLALLIRSTQQPAAPPTAQIVLMPPDPPSLTKEDQKKTEALIKQLGWKGYQRYIEQKTGEKARPSLKDQNLKPCVVPLPKYFARACFLRVALRPGQTVKQASETLRTTHPQWFIGPPPNKNTMGTP